ncbi:MAG: dihydropteroate synthase [Lentisphaeria bacterium]|jgi:cobalamin-dependent methionine synthase I
MSIPGLTIIGERINPGFRSSLALFEKSDLDGIRALAVEQVQKGARYLNVNIGNRALTDHAFMKAVITNIQDAVAVPLSFDFPNVEVQKVCLETYDERKAGGQKPIINSISELRWEMTSLLEIRPCKILLMASERELNGEKVANKSAADVFETARRMVGRLLEGKHGLTLDDLFIDVSVGPVAVDMEGLTRMAIQAIRQIGAAPELKGIHMSVGLSNISIMVPAKALDGSPLKLQLESAFLTNTVPYGLDTIIGTAGRDYQLLAPDNFVLRGFNEAMALEEIESVMRIQALYQAE